MILPEKLAELFYEKLAFYSCTVSTFEQYTLASFISQGFFEKHINRMRLHYGRKRARVIEIIKKYFTEDECRIIENDSGLHFILEFNMSMSDIVFKELLKSNNILISSVTDFKMDEEISDTHQFILNYSNIDVDRLDSVMKTIKGLIN